MIVESPTKAKKIAGYLGKDWNVIATLGHIRDLPEDDLGVDVNNGFLPTYNVYEEKKPLVAKLKKAAIEAKEVYLASDPDREGEAIAFHTLSALKLKQHKRITFSEISKPAIEKAIKNSRTIDMNLVAAQEARRVLDRLFGYIISPILCKQSNLKLSAGRVQSPALKIIYIRNAEIENFVKTNFFELVLKFNGLDLTCVNTSFSDSKDKVTDKAIYQDIIDNTTQVSIEKISGDVKSINPKPCFTTSTLQQAASNIFDMQPKKTMEAAQKLFENGFITYHRTDSPNLSTERYQSLVSHLTAKGLPVRDKQHTYATGENAQEAHEAIAPTDLNLADISADFDTNCRNLYKLILERTLLSAMPNGKDETCKLIATSNHTVNGRHVKFEVSETISLELGWRQYLNVEKVKDKKEQASLPADFDAQMNVSKENFVILEKFTKPASRYSPADIIKVLEKLGIGRPSTYAAIIEGLLERNYIKIDKKFIEITELGKRVVEALSTQQFLNLNFTQVMETELDEIATGKKSYLSLVSKTYQLLEDQKGQIEFK